MPSVLNSGLGKVPPSFWAIALSTTFAIGCIGKEKEAQIHKQGGIYTPGDLGFDPFELKALTREGRSNDAEAEIFNGRLAMLSLPVLIFRNW